MKNNKFNKKRTCFFTIAFYPLAAILHAQWPIVEEARSTYPNAGAIYLNKAYEFKIFLENGNLSGLCNVHEQIYINKESGLSYQTKAISTGRFVEASDIEAYTLVPKKKKYEKKKVENIELKDNPGKNVFYDDEKSYNIVYPFVQPGAILDLSYQLKYLEPRLMGGYFWIDYIPNMESELVISVQKNIDIKYKFFNCENENFFFTKEEKRNEVVYRWKLKRISTGVFYSDAPNFKYFEPHLIFYITNYKVSGKDMHLLGTPKELHSWYCDLQKNINKTEDSRLKHLADSLVEGIIDQSEKIKKIFYWVQDNISYVAFEDGLGGWVPRDAGLVLMRKFGDCKDMASIIHEMLRIVGVPSYLTWIGSRDIPYSYDDVPTPSVDNHMITSYLDKDSVWHFLDGTGKNAPIELYTSFIQGKQAMISINPDSFLLVTVPVKDTTISQVVDSITIDINDNLVTGNGNVMLTGYDRLNYLYHMENLNREERLDLFKTYFAKGNNKVAFSNIIEKSSNRLTPLSFNYTFSVPDYIRINQDEMYINLNMGTGWGLEQLDEKRKVPLSFKHVTKKRLITTLNLPTGYKPDFIPQNTTIKNEVIGYTSFYSFKGNKIILTSDFYINTLLLKVSDFSKYNQVISELIKANKQIVSLKKI